jgi:hypothetical protein
MESGRRGRIRDPAGNERIAIAVGKCLVNPRVAGKKILAEAQQMRESFDSRNK